MRPPVHLRRSPTVQLLSELSKAVPSNTEAKLEVKELTLNTRSLRFRADTTGYEAAAAIEASLKKNERFAAVTKGEEKKKGDELSFTITIPFDEEEEESP